MRITRRNQNQPLLKGLSFERKHKVWISPSKIRNALQNDPISDLFPLPKSESSFLSFLFEQENMFKACVFRYISDKIYPVLNLNSNFYTQSNKSVFQLMDNGVPFISNVPLRNPYMAIRGVADLLVRSDFINKLVPGTYTHEQEFLSAPKLKDKKFHYVLVEIKFSTLYVNKKMEIIPSSNTYLVSKTYIFNRMLHLLQGTMLLDTTSFAIGRKYNFLSTKNSVLTPMSCLAKVVVPSATIEKTKAAIKHVRKLSDSKYIEFLKTEASLNMSYAMTISKEKMEIALSRKELTLISSVGEREKKIALSHGITNFMDSRCCAENLGITDPTKAKWVNAIIEVNRNPTLLYLPKDYKMKHTKTNVNIFLDFETISDLFCDFDNFPNLQSSTFIFLAGVTVDGKYTSFCLEELTLAAEEKLLIEFIDFINLYGRNATVWYWYAELHFLNAALDRHPGLRKKLKILPEFVDMYERLKEDGFAVKDCFKYGLKHIAKAMAKHSLIRFDVDSQCQDGMTASMNAWIYYKNGKKDVKIMNDIIRYNYYDCYAMEEIFNFAS